MLKKLKIRVRLIIYISFLITLTMSVISIVVFNYSKNELNERLENKLFIINELKKEHVQSYFKQISENINHIEYDFGIEQELSSVVHLNSDVDSLNKHAQEAKSVLSSEFRILERSFGFHRIMFKSLDGNSLVETKEHKNLKSIDSLFYLTNSHFFLDARKNTIYSDVYHPFNKEEAFYITILTPFTPINRTEPIGILACEISMNEIFNVIQDSTGLGIYGETLIAKRLDAPYVQLLKKPKGFSGDVLNSRYGLEGNSNDFKAVQIAVSDKTASGRFARQILDYNDIEVDMSWSYLPELNWAIYTKMNHAVSSRSIQYLRAIIILLCSGILFFSIITITIFVDRFLTPIIKIRDNMVKLSRGLFPKKLSYEMNDEIHDTANALNNLIDRLKSSTDFAQQLGKGDLNVEYQGVNDQDVLSVALIEMRESLRELERQNNRRKWATEGLAIHGELLRKNNDNLEKLGEKFISSLVSYVNGVHGAVYSISHIGSSSGLISLDDDNTYFELIGTYAYDLKEDNPRKIFSGKGLIGQCAKERKTIKVDDVPHDYLMISSGLGKANVTHVLCVPMIVNTQVMGVVELTNFKSFEPHVIEFIETLGESFASAVMTVKLSEQTQDTLKEFESTTSELLEKESELQVRYERALNEIEKLRASINKLEKSPENRSR